MGKEWGGIRRICQYNHSQEWPDTHNPQSAKKKISSFFHDSLALLFASLADGKKLFLFLETSQQGVILMCLIITSLYLCVIFSHHHHFCYHYP